MGAPQLALLRPTKRQLFHTKCLNRPPQGVMIVVEARGDSLW